MSGAATQNLQQSVADLLQAQSSLDLLGVVSRHGDGALVPQEIRRVQKVDVQGVALNPFATIEQAAQGANLGRRSNSQSRFDGVHRAHLVGHRADAADAGYNVGDFLKVATAKESLEETWRLENVYLHFAQFPALRPDVNPAFAFNAGQIFNLDCLTRVEGEGGVYVRSQGGELREVKINIFEPPRFFEAFLRGRFLQEVPDITARICGICPVAYQMSAVHALEAALKVTP